MNKLIASLLASGFLLFTGSVSSAITARQRSTQSSTATASKQQSSQQGNGTPGASTPHTTTELKRAPLRIAVMPMTRSTNLPISTDGFQQELANQINFLGGKAVILGTDPSDREASMEEAKQQGCNYIIFTDIIGYKAARPGEKLGRVFNHGGLGGVGGADSGRVEMSADVRVFQPDNPVVVLVGNNSFRGIDPDHTANGLMQTEARTVMLQIKNLQKGPATAPVQ